jgi:FkbM family methyltransferase
MNISLDKLKTKYWSARETFPLWLNQHRPAELGRQLKLRFQAWRNPVVDIDGVRIARSPRYTIPVLESLASGSYELPEARIMRHALAPDDTVLELGTGLGYLSILCARMLGSERVHTYEANPALKPIIENQYALNQVAPRLNICLLGEAHGEITFYLMKNFWSSSTIQRHPKAKPIQVPVKPFNEVRAAIRPNFLIVDIEGGERDLFRFAQLEGVDKLCIELHPHVIGQSAVDAVVAAIIHQGLIEDTAVSDTQHKLFIRASASTPD